MTPTRRTPTRRSGFGSPCCRARRSRRSRASEAALHPWTSYVVVPLFALANAGVRLSVDASRAAMTSRVTLGVVLGLVARQDPRRHPRERRSPFEPGSGVSRPGCGWRHIVGLSAVAGVGFTVSLFIAELAFADPALADRGEGRHLRGIPGRRRPRVRGAAVAARVESPASRGRRGDVSAGRQAVATFSILLPLPAGRDRNRPSNPTEEVLRCTVSSPRKAGRSRPSSGRSRTTPCG